MLKRKASVFARHIGNPSRVPNINGYKRNVIAQLKNNARPSGESYHHRFANREYSIAVARNDSSSRLFEDYALRKKMAELGYYDKQTTAASQVDDDTGKDEFRLIDVFSDVQSNRTTENRKKTTHLLEFYVKDNLFEEGVDILVAGVCDDPDIVRCADVFAFAMFEKRNLEDFMKELIRLLAINYQPPIALCQLVMLEFKKESTEEYTQKATSSAYKDYFTNYLNKGIKNKRFSFYDLYVCSPPDAERSVDIAKASRLFFAEKIIPKIDTGEDFVSMPKTSFITESQKETVDGDCEKDVLSVLNVDRTYPEAKDDGIVIPHYKSKSTIDIGNLDGSYLLKQLLKILEEKDLSLDEIQTKLERSATLAAIFKAEQNEKAQGHNYQIERIIKRLIVPLSKAIAKESQFCSSSTRPFIQCLEPAECAYIALCTALAMTAEGGAHYKEVVLSIGNQINEEYHYRKFKDVATSSKSKNLQKELHKLEGLVPGTPKFIKTYNYIVSKNPGVMEEMQYVPWVDAVQLEVGSFYTDCLLKNCFFEPKVRNLREDVPGKAERIRIFTDPMRVGAEGLRRGFLDLHELFRLQLKNKVPNLSGNLKLLPMVTKPLPYIKNFQGGYFTRSRNIVRASDNGIQVTLIDRSLTKKDKDGNHKLSQVFKGLNVVARTEWAINKNILEIVKYVQKNGGNPKLKIPKYGTEEAVDFTKVTSNTIQDRIDLFRKAKQKNQSDLSLKSLQSSENYKIIVADAYRNHKFYFPADLDFRGRCYAVPPYLNHIGNDLCRGLLIFNEKKRLGARGLYWLRIHTANLFGADKLPLVERHAFTEANIDTFLRCASDPMKHTEWMDADAPFQCLAAMIELSQALKLDNPEDYYTGLPVHQDGSCNGLQHYAALGRDSLGGLHVNLVPAERPGDVYQGVCDQVNKFIERDLRPNADSYNQSLAKILHGKVNRKVVKQTVMTVVYGVTQLGARRQISNRLKERGDVHEEHIQACSGYLTKRIFASIDEVFFSAQTIQKWLGSCAAIIAARNKPLVWSSAINLPVVQNYHKHAQIKITSTGKDIAITSSDSSKDIIKGKQRNALPPNFIHSLDASHMFMTAIACHEKGLVFASVHDSFWTHPCDVDVMNECLREQFVKLHREPILEKLKAEWEDIYADDIPVFPDIPRKGDLDIEKVLESKYFFA